MGVNDQCVVVGSSRMIVGSSHIGDVLCGFLLQLGSRQRQYMFHVMVEVANRLKQATSFPQCMEYLLHSVLHAVCSLRMSPQTPSSHCSHTQW